ncbi:hypothetical protein [Lentzea sp. NBRC 102530]|uniref:hypothetical protein n=1 Tax=Lentzea sp. NBRC 102530 TaxID=3032201 RepID=UPI0024A31026|nr:hypothetical protein [Lentzea sp. NBRC 102530]GLY51828.1 hypothetical protein Lesp01_54840 [Lentzea sp. NBRC 102530]
MKTKLAVACAFVAFAFMGASPAGAEPAPATPSGAAIQQSGEMSAQACFPRRATSGNKWQTSYCDDGQLSGKMITTPTGQCVVGRWEWWRERSFPNRIVLGDQYLCVDSWNKMADKVYADDSLKICARVMLRQGDGSYVEWGSAACA